MLKIILDYLLGGNGDSINGSKGNSIINECGMSSVSGKSDKIIDSQENLYYIQRYNADKEFGMGFRSHLGYLTLFTTVVAIVWVSNMNEGEIQNRKLASVEDGVGGMGDYSSVGGFVKSWLNLLLWSIWASVVWVFCASNKGRMKLAYSKWMVAVKKFRLGGSGRKKIAKEKNL